MEGNIVVDGVLASCYPSSDHDLAHIGMAPIRWFPGITQWIFGEDNGWSVFTKINEGLGKLVLPFTQLNRRGNFWKKTYSLCQTSENNLNITFPKCIDLFHKYLPVF